jgi:hypothetical protein
VAPLFEPMERSAMAVLAKYRNEELQLLLNFLDAARDAGLAAMTELRALPAVPARARRIKPKS